MKVVSLVCVLLLVGSLHGSRLVYLDKPAEEDNAAFVAKLTQNLDVRGDYGNFVLVADASDDVISDHVVFENFDGESFTYFVAERAALMSSPVAEGDDVIFNEYTNVAVLNKYIFAVVKAQEDVFVGKVPFYLEIVRVPESALPAPALETKEINVAAPDPVIAGLVAQVTSQDLYNFVTYLTGEDGSGILTRQAQSPGAVSAQNYLLDQFAGFGFSVSLQPFRSGYSSNVVASLPGIVDPKQLVLVTAHYDSRGPSSTSTTQRAPGANDNGSGTGSLLQIAKLIYTNKLSFAYTVVLIAFSGEEQGLYGSAYAAQQYKTQGANIIAVLNGDMLAYRVSTEAAQLAFTSRSSTATLNTQLANITRLYVPGLTVGATTACCTDHSSFYNQGFPATSYYERNGNIADPQYHQSGDLVNRPGYDISLQYPLIVQSMFAGLLTIAQYQL